VGQRERIVTRKGCLFGENKENRQVETTAASKRLKTPVRLDENVEGVEPGWEEAVRVGGILFG